MKNPLNLSPQEEDLIQELIYLSREADTLWEYHPNNLEGKNLIVEYDYLLKKIKSVEEKLKEFNQDFS